MERLKKGLAFIYEPTPEELATINKQVEKQDEINRVEHPDDYFVMSALKQLYPSISREAGGDIFEIVAQGGEGKHFHGKFFSPSLMNHDLI